MPRKVRVTLPGVTQHVIQRGNNRQPMFHDDQDRGLFSAWLSRYALKYEVAIHAWVYMSNHIHVLATPSIDGGLPKMMQALGRHYVRYFNKRHRRTGTLFEGRYKSCVVDCDSYVLACSRYIEMNPVRAGLTARPGEYYWSSYRSNAHGRPCEFTQPHSTYIGLGRTPGDRMVAYRRLFDLDLSELVLEDIRSATHRGHALGSENFKRAIEASSGVKLTPGKPGRPRIK